MDHFTHRDGVLYAEDVALPAIAEAVGTPFYVYSSATLDRHVNVFKQGFEGADHLVAFAVKALSNLSVLSFFAERGLGADIVSGGEMARALRAGIPAERIVFSGVGKTEAEMAQGIEAGIFQFNIESETELRTLSEVAVRLGREAPIALRVNPDVDAGTHEKISTGRKTDKFGVPAHAATRLYALASDLPGIKPQGLAMHIGSQITQLAPLTEAVRRVADMIRDLRAEGYEVTTIDVGGGLGIPYADEDNPPAPTDYATEIRKITEPLGVKVVMEPGRMIAGNAGLFVTSLIRLKQQDGVTFAIVDGAMNDLMRPALYGSVHKMVPVAPREGEARTLNIAGPVCESTDIFSKNVGLSDPRPGDLVAYRSAGAYGAVQANQYNTRPLVPEVLVEGGKFKVIRRRPSLDEMLSLEAAGDWQSA